MRPKPKCFCKERKDDCPTCTKVDWSKVRPSTGRENADRIVSARVSMARA